jgi:hypothetical protein
MKDCSYTNGRLKAPDEIHMLRQGYFMEEEWYAKSKRKQREEEAKAAEVKAQAEAKAAEAAAAQKETKETFMAVTGRPGMAETAGWHAHDGVSRQGLSAAEAVQAAIKNFSMWTWATPEAKAKREAEAQAKAQAQAQPAEVAEAQPEPAEHSTNCMCAVCFWKREAKEGRYPPVVAPNPATITRGPLSTQNIISTAAAKVGAKDDDLAKAIFAAMGTPYDSKCPHGLPFYACMSCSH